MNSLHHSPCVSVGSWHLWSLIQKPLRVNSQIFWCFWFWASWKTLVFCWIYPLLHCSFFLCFHSLIWYFSLPSLIWGFSPLWVCRGETQKSWIFSSKGSSQPGWASPGSAGAQDLKTNYSNCLTTTKKSTSAISLGVLLFWDLQLPPHEGTQNLGLFRGSAEVLSPPPPLCKVAELLMLVHESSLCWRDAGLEAVKEPLLWALESKKI